MKSMHILDLQITFVMKNLQDTFVKCRTNFVLILFCVKPVDNWQFHLVQSPV